MTHKTDSAFASSETAGLSKREYFAGLAMQGMISNPEFTKILADKLDEKYHASFVCGCAVEQADALIEALNVNP